MIIKTTLACAATLVLVGCGASSPHGVEERYFLIGHNLKIPYWQEVGAGLSKAAAQLGVKAEMVGPDTYDPAEQQQEFRKAVQKKPTGILVSPGDPALLKPDIDAAIAAGIPVITVDSDAPASKRLLFIGTNNYEAGLRGGRLLAEQLHGKGSVVVFTNPRQANLQERMNGYKDALEAFPQIKIVEVIDVHGDARVAFDRAEEIVEKGKPPADAFVSLEAVSGKEIAEVLDRKRVTGKTVVAMDTAAGTLEWIEKGTIVATLGQKPFTMAYYGLKMLDDLHHHKLPSLGADFAQDSFAPIPKFVDTGLTLIDKSNLAAFRQASDAARK